MSENNSSNGNGGTIKSVVGVASKTVSALSGTPMLLVLTLLNAAMFGMITWLVMQSAEYRFKERTELIQLLRNCVVRHLEKSEMNNDSIPKIEQEHAIEIQIPNSP